MGDGRRRFVITGLSRLSVRVARLLAEGGGDVVVITGDGDGDGDAVLEAAIPSDARLVRGSADRAGTLVATEVDVAGADALLALDDDDLENLRSVSCAAAVGPGVPVVLRSFDAALADQLEVGSNVRRAYSLSALAAPSFVAAAVGGEAAQTLRLGTDEIPLVRLAVGADGPLTGRTAAEVAERTRTVVVARQAADGWRAEAAGGPPLRAGEAVLLGGHRHDVLRAALGNQPLPEPPTLARRRRVAPERRRPRVGLTSTLLPAAVALLVLLVVIATVTFGATRNLATLDALYFTLTTAWGNAALSDAGSWEQVIGLGLMLGVGALVGVLFSHVAAIAAAERTEHRMSRQAGRQKGHVVVVGVGTIGYRVIRLLHELDVDVVAIEGSAASRFLGAAAVHGPVLVGDARLPEDLARTGIDRASCVIAVTDDDLVNVSACLQAKAANDGIRTVARVFDETIADHVGEALGIDAVLSASRSAAPAFAGAALDDRAPRRIAFDHLDLVAFRHTFDDGVPSSERRAAWLNQGVQVVAENGPTAIICGPRDAAAVQELLRS